MEKSTNRNKGAGKELSKIRVLAIAIMLNEGRKLTVTDILRRLDLQYDIQADRKTIYSDIQSIDKFIPIDAISGKGGGYIKHDFGMGTLGSVSEAIKGGVTMENENISNGCPYNIGATCDPKKGNCERCGWNPAVSQQRLAKFCEKHGIKLPVTNEK